MQALHHPFSYAINPAFVGSFPVIYACSSPAADASCSPAASPPACCGRVPYPTECAASGPRPTAPRPFTIEAILGLDAGQLTDERGGDKSHRPPSAKTGLKCRAAMNGHRRISTNGKECRRTFSDSGLHELGEKTTKSKRVRTIFTPEQLERLEVEFERQQYMVGPERLYLAATLNLTEAQVKVWFQNRRIKWRKQHLEMQQARLAKIREADGDPQDSFVEDLAESSDEDIP